MNTAITSPALAPRARLQDLLRGAGDVYALQLVLVTLAYFGSAKLGLELAFANSNITAIWAPSGVALAAILILGRRIWPAVALGAFLANITTSGPAEVALAITVGNTLEPLLGAWLLERVGLRHSLDRMRDVIALLLLAGGLSTIVSATIGVLSLHAAGAISSGDLVSSWRVWWLGDMGGDLLVAPALLVLAARGWRGLRSARTLEAVVAIGALAVLSALVLRQGTSLGYSIFPLLFWIGLRFRQTGAVIAGLIVSGYAVWYTARGLGPFVGGAPDAELLRAQTFAGVATATTLLVAAVRTEHRHAEAARARLAASEHALAEAQTLAHLGSWDWTIETGEVNWSDELYRVYGVEGVGFEPSFESFRELVHEDERTLLDEELSRALEARGPFRLEHRIVRPDGDVRTLEARGSVVCDERGRPIKMVGTGQDITAFKLANERFRALLEAAPDAIVIVDEAGLVTLVNSQTEKLFGYARAELIGQPVELLVPDRFPDLHPPPAGGLAANPPVLPSGAGLEVRARRSDGTRFPVEITLSPMETEEGMVLSAAIRDVTERKRAEERLEHEARHDPLTGLPNRVLLLDRMEHALARARRPRWKLGVLFCDVDDFKRVNESLGHDAGDEILVSLAARLRKALNPGDTVARCGGDEFVVLLEDLSDPAEAGLVAERLSALIARPFIVGGTEYFLTLSVGVVVVDADATSPAAALRDADAAMYRAKTGGKGRYEVSDEQTRVRLAERLRIESELHKAIERGEFRVLYQPIVALDGGELVGAEALVRWQHPERGLLAPAEFMATAEDSGLIVPIGAIVLEEACREAASWPVDHAGAEALRISVNLSPHQVARPDTAETVARILRDSGLDPRRLALEITESVLLEEDDAAVEALRVLKAQGVRLVLDDFGTGYSSLSYLKRFTIDALKIDRAFVHGLGRDAGDSAIVAAVLSMAKALDIGVVAEGVETSAQEARLRALGCLYGQGYLYSRPVPASELARLLTQSDAAPRPLVGAP